MKDKYTKIRQKIVKDSREYKGLVSNYSNWKNKTHGTSNVTIRELNLLKKFNKPKRDK
jgi:hypothetical protein